MKRMKRKFICEFTSLRPCKSDIGALRSVYPGSLMDRIEPLIFRKSSGRNVFCGSFPLSGCGLSNEPRLHSFSGLVKLGVERALSRLLGSPSLAQSLLHPLFSPTPSLLRLKRNLQHRRIYTYASVVYIYIPRLNGMHSAHRGLNVSW
ncbi:hypothetical protein BDN70DRAFT_275989 [Pholiota conissans]|uniref:Uncharacterized protein n=1 Tax=Pholiota conissans TaxID=109636 RepID=A0A9P6D520_9AGAR|nr:hypothetical protein BDN70DRAFT_275989 [Pholiota conissans]